MPASPDGPRIAALRGAPDYYEELRHCRIEPYRPAHERLRAFPIEMTCRESELSIRTPWWAGVRPVK